ncbi:replicative DNA helicase [Mitsuokella multacida]|uniref:replicative DNA helicase n=1 Tax=Mitsuokella multacida TaxID=52226 RepID=UPI00241E4D6E|nr:replicative DNA helicase [Mitsuokella multacida]
MNDMDLYSVEAEQGILGAILIRPGIVPHVSSLVRPEDFYKQAHRITFQIMQEMALQGESVDLVNLAEQLRRAGMLEKAGGVAYVTHLGNVEATAAGVDGYCQTVREYSRRRQIVSLARQAMGAACDMGKSVEEVEDGLQAALTKGEQLAKRKGLYDAKALIFALQDDIDRRARGEQIGVKTGIRGIDAHIGSMEPGNLVIIAGRPSHGKSALACTIAINAARAGKRVLWFTMEMDAVETARRIVSQISGIDNRKFKTRALQGMTEDERGRYIAAYEKVARMGLHVSDVTNQTPLDIWRTAQGVKAVDGLDLIIIDYIGLMSAGSRKKENRVQEVSYITRMLKNMAGALQVPVLALSQLNRANDKENRMPRLSDLRDSGSIEQDANVVMLIQRDSHLSMQGTPVYEKTVTLDIAKVRDGATGTVKLDFYPAFSVFQDHRGA